MERDAMDMPMLTMEAETTASPNAAVAKISAPDNGTNVVTLSPSRPPWTSKLHSALKSFVINVTPPAIVIALFLLLWEWICRRTGATLPPPSKVLRDTRELILDPFFDHGGIDKGLFWHLSASL